MLSELKEALQRNYQHKEIALQSVSGGDINLAFRLSVGASEYFVKVNTSTEADGILQSEYDALVYLKKAGIRVPTCYVIQPFAAGHFLIMEYLPPGRPSPASWKDLALEMLKLHHITNEQFGWKENNYIGSLFQPNRWHTAWSDFYINERLIPQFQLARDKKYVAESDGKLFDIFLKNIVDLLPKKIKPALLHGDFWSGNYHLVKGQKPYLIDPSIYFGHREVDLAMARLFGGFDPDFFQHYYDSVPPETGYQNRIPLYQLYYILVHLNLFGWSYYERSMSIIKTYC